MYARRLLSSPTTALSSNITEVEGGKQRAMRKRKRNEQNTQVLTLQNPAALAMAAMSSL
jgi:hypothetical protein